MNTFSDRLNYAMEFYKKNVDNTFTQKKIAKSIGITPQAISELKRGFHPGSKYISQIANYLGFSAFWLATGNGNPHNPSTNPHQKNTLKNHIPILDWEEILKWCDNSDHSLDLSIDHRKYIATPFPEDGDKHLFAVIVDNETMSAISENNISFPRGCIVIADPMRVPKSGEYLIGIWTNSKKPIFRQYIEEGDKRYIKPIATQFKAEVINANFIPLATAVERRDDLISQ